MRLRNNSPEKKPSDRVETRFGPMTRSESWVYPHVNNQQLIWQNRAIQEGAREARTNTNNIPADVLKSTEKAVGDLLDGRIVVPIQEATRNGMPPEDVQISVSNEVNDLLNAA